MDKSSDVWIAPMVADVGVFQVADVPMYGYDYTLPSKKAVLNVNITIESGLKLNSE